MSDMAPGNRLSRQISRETRNIPSFAGAPQDIVLRCTLHRTSLARVLTEHRRHTWKVAIGPVRSTSGVAGERLAWPCLGEFRLKDNRPPAFVLDVSRLVRATLVVAPAWHALQPPGPGYAQDVRPACFGLDRNDNDFIIALIGAELAPLSKCVEMMRKTRQTSQYIQSMGPFFVGEAVWQSAAP